MYLVLPNRIIVHCINSLYSTIQEYKTQKCNIPQAQKTTPISFTLLLILRFRHLQRPRCPVLLVVEHMFVRIQRQRALVHQQIHIEFFGVHGVRRHVGKMCRGGGCKRHHNPTHVGWKGHVAEILRPTPGPTLILLVKRVPVLNGAAVAGPLQSNHALSPKNTTSCPKTARCPKNIGQNQMVKIKWVTKKTQ